MPERGNPDCEKAIQLDGSHLPQTEAFRPGVPTRFFKIRTRNILSRNEAVQHSNKSLVSRSVFCNGRRQVALERFAGAVKSIVLTSRGLDVTGDAILIVLLEHRRHDGDLRLVGNGLTVPKPIVNLQNGIA